MATMSESQFKDKVFVITGANSGLGKELTVALSKLGARLVLTARDEGRLGQVRDACVSNGLDKAKVVIVAGDLTKAETRQKLVDTTIETFGRIDVLVNCASAMPLGFLKDVTEDGLDQAYAINVKVPFFLIQAFIPHLIKSKGNVINISTVLSVEHYPGGIAYSVTKAAQDFLTRASAIELGPKGVRVNSINPGMFITDSMARVVHYDPKFAGSKDPLAEFASFHGRQHAMLRNAEPQEVVDSILFLASAQAGFVTAVNLMVDGGRSVYYHRNLPVQMPDYDEAK